MLQDMSEACSERPLGIPNTQREAEPSTEGDVIDPNLDATVIDQEATLIDEANNKEETRGFQKIIDTSYNHAHQQSTDTSNVMTTTTEAATTSHNASEWENVSSHSIEDDGTAYSPRMSAEDVEQIVQRDFQSTPAALLETLAQTRQSCDKLKDNCDNMEDTVNQLHKSVNTIHNKNAQTARGGEIGQTGQWTNDE